MTIAQEAQHAAHRLPPQAPAGRLFPISPAAADLYTVSVHWALGDAGAALDAGQHLRPERFPTAERKARLGTDMARTWRAWGSPEQTAHALLNGQRASPGEVRDGPAIRNIVTEPTRCHPRTSGVRELHVAVPAPPLTSCSLAGHEHPVLCRARAEASSR
ncbi:hypothetical protein [Streptomyces drozdowiczii]